MQRQNMDGKADCLFVPQKVLKAKKGMSENGKGKIIFMFFRQSFNGVKP
jgi:hypothetical protein